MSSWHWCQSSSLYYAVSTKLLLLWAPWRKKAQLLSSALSPVYLPTWKKCDVEIPLKELKASVVIWNFLTLPARPLHHPMPPGSGLQIWSLSDPVSTWLILIHQGQLTLCCFSNICLSKFIIGMGIACPWHGALMHGQIFLAGNPSTQNSGFGWAHS